MANLIGDTPDPNTAGVLGKSTNDTNAAGPGVHGVSKAVGVIGESSTWHGVAGFSKSETGGFGVYGEGIGPGVVGKSKTWHAVAGFSESTTGGIAVYGEAVGTGPGVVGVSKNWVGVYGETAGIENGPAGVWGEHKGAGVGVKAVSKDGKGLVAFSTGGFGVFAESDKSAGVVGMSKNWVGVYGETAGIEGGPAGVWGEHKGAGDGVKAVSNVGHGIVAFTTNGPAAIHAQHMGNRTAGRFVGDVEVTGDIRLTNADCAEDFDISGEDKVEPGTVVVLGNEGALFQSQQAYDKRVAGVISGAGDYKPAIVLDKRESQGNRQPVALMGKVFCKVDAQFGAIEVGDLLTTSSTPGHAMKAGEPLQAFGSVIGKALRPLKEGQQLIPVLIALQ